MFSVDFFTLCASTIKFGEEKKKKNWKYVKKRYEDTVGSTASLP